MIYKKAKASKQWRQDALFFDWDKDHIILYSVHLFWIDISKITHCRSKYVA